MSVKIYKSLVDYQNEIKKKSKNIDSKYLCEGCQSILLGPHQTECGSRYCKSCIDNWAKECIKYCPSCKNKISSLSNNLRYDKAIEKEIFYLKINCLNVNCVKIVQLKDLFEHLQICEFREINCELCNENILFSNNEFHLENKCKKKLIKCSHCKIEMTRDELENKHQNVNPLKIENLCEKWKSNCPLKCCDEIFDNVKSHLEISCPNRQVKCQFSEFGCKKYLTENQSKEHIKNEAHFHLKLLVDFIGKTSNENRSIQSQFKQQQNEMLSEIEELKLSSLKISETISQISKTYSTDNSQISTIKSEFETLKNENKIGKLNNQSSSSSLNRNFQFGSSSDNEVISNNGSFTWTIRDIRRKIENAKNNIDTQLLSKPFYTDRSGYKMLFKVFPNGDGIAKNNFLSVFVVIMKGEYDEELLWPFSKKITLILIKNETEIYSTKVVMKPQNNIACYGKPINTCNIGSGQPEFVKIPDLIRSGKYTENGGLIIRLLVEL